MQGRGESLAFPMRSLVAAMLIAGVAPGCLAGLVERAGGEAGVVAFALDEARASVAWRVGGGAWSLHLDFASRLDEATGFYLVDLARDGVRVVVDAAEFDRSHLGRGPAPVAAGVGDETVESPQVFPTEASRVTGQRNDVVTRDGVLVACWGRGIDDVRLTARGLRVEGPPVQAAADAWILKDVPGGARARAGPVNAATDGRLHVAPQDAMVLVVAAYASDQSSGRVAVTAGGVTREVAFEPSAVPAPDLVRHQVALYTRGAADVAVSVAGENAETKVFVTTCEVPAAFEEDAWDVTRRSIG